MKSHVNIGLLGFGNVGQMVYELVNRNAAILTPKSPWPLNIMSIAVRDKAKARQVSDSLVVENLFTSDIKNIVTNPEIDIVVELMGDVPEAFEAMRLALENGKHVSLQIKR